MILLWVNKEINDLFKYMNELFPVIAICLKIWIRVALKNENGDAEQDYSITQ